MAQRPSGISIKIREDLVAGSARTQTTLICDPIITLDGHRVVMSDIGDICFAKLNQGTSNEEIISFTGITDNTTTYTLTGCVWGYNFYDRTGSVQANKKKQNSGTSLIISTDDHQLGEQFVASDNPTASASYTESTGNNLTTKDYVDTRDGYWTGAVANYAALPAGAIDGEVRVTLDDSKIYVWDSGTTAWVLAGAGGGAGTVYVTTKLGTEADGDDNATFSLTSGSWTDSKYLQVYLNGVLQELGATEDYTATDNNTIVFNSAILDTDKVTMLVVSVDLYNPAWGTVNASILPDTHNTYDIGATGTRFKDAYLEGNADIDGTMNVEGVATFQALPTIPETPSANTDAASKGYVDGLPSAINVFNPGITTDGAVTTATGTKTISVDVGIVPKYFEAIITTELTQSFVRNYAGGAAPTGRNTAVLRGIIGGNTNYIYVGLNNFSILPSTLLTLTPYWARNDSDGVFIQPTYGIFTTASMGTTISATVNTAGNLNRLALTSVTLSGTTLTFTWTFTKGANDCGLRYGVEHLVVIK